MVFGDALDRPSPLSSQIACKTRDLDWTLAHFTFVADVTTLVAECDIAHSPLMSVASCRSMPKQALAFVGESSDLLATYATFLADPGSEVDLLVNEEQRPVVEQAFEVRSVVTRWQMLYRGDPDDLDPGRATALADNDLAAALALAKAEGVTLALAADEPFAQGPAFGIWERRKLAALGTTSICLPGVAQIDNVLTRSEYRRQGYGEEIVSALVLAHLAEDRGVFVVVDEAQTASQRLYETLGFVRERPMYLMTCVLKAVR
jgi:ribosomal protein S18 acetylase RimI-like enzyme